MEKKKGGKTIKASERNGHQAALTTQNRPNRSEDGAVFPVLEVVLAVVDLAPDGGDQRVSCACAVADDAAGVGLWFEDGSLKRGPKKAK